METQESLKSLEIVGIDFGTSNTTITRINDNGFPQLLTDLKYGKSLIPTAVGIDEGKFVFGQDAINLAPEHKPLFRNLKRELGSKNKKYNIELKTGPEIITSEELIVKYLEFLRKHILKNLDGQQFGAVISTPAYFNQDQRLMLQNCFTKAGYTVLSMISEPVAACISYANENMIENEQVVVFDMGGGTTDVALIKLSDGKYEAMPTNGNSNLGGADFTNLIIERIVNKLTIEQGLPDTTWFTDSMRQYVFEVIELVKSDLSKHNSTNIVLSNFIQTSSGKFVDFEYKITREEFARICSSLIDKATTPVVDCIKYNDIDKKKVKKVLMIGGGSYTWGVKERIEQIFPNANIILDSNAKFCVSKGNGLFGFFQKDYQKSIIIEKVNKSIGVVAINPNNPKEPVFKRKIVKIIHRGDDIPAYGSYTFRTSVENQKDAEIVLTQGEGYTFESTDYIGTVTLDNIGVEKAGINKITVELKIDEKGLLTVVVSDSIKYRKEIKQLKLDHSWTTADYVKLQEAKKKQEQAEKDEEEAINWTKYVKFYNEQFLKLQELPPSPALEMMKDKLAEIKEAIKVSHWDIIKPLQQEYIQIMNDVSWEENDNKQVSLKKVFGDKFADESEEDDSEKSDTEPSWESEYDEDDLNSSEASDDASSKPTDNKPSQDQQEKPQEN